jgi:hypothetical protein
MEGRCLQRPRAIHSKLERQFNVPNWTENSPGLQPWVGAMTRNPLIRLKRS